MNQRLLTLDLLRGSAIILMMIFHLSFDLNYFQFTHIDIYRGLFWKLFRWLIVSMFLFAVGYSLVLAYKDKINWEKLAKRGALLGFYALLISIATYMIFPRSWIYFGVLHFIFTATFLGLFFIRLPKTALVTAVVIFVGTGMGWLHTQWLYDGLKPFLMLPRSAEDLVPVFPWFGVVLLGIYAASKQGLPPVPANGVNKKIAFLGRHSLTIYMVHQPIFFGVLYGINWIFL